MTSPHRSWDISDIMIEPSFSSLDSEHIADMVRDESMEVNCALSHRISVSLAAAPSGARSSSFTFDSLRWRRGVFPDSIPIMPDIMSKPLVVALGAAAVSHAICTNPRGSNFCIRLRRGTSAFLSDLNHQLAASFVLSCLTAILDTI